MSTKVYIVECEYKGMRNTESAFSTLDKAYERKKYLIQAYPEAAIYINSYIVDEWEIK